MFGEWRSPTSLKLRGAREVIYVTDAKLTKTKMRNRGQFSADTPDAQEHARQMGRKGGHQRSRRSSGKSHQMSHTGNQRNGKVHPVIRGEESMDEE